jgi:phospholipid/cholesterol/gamma-HCH transport system substrate-binding protein
MENRAFAIATGLFVVLLGAAMALAVWWFGGETKPHDDYLLVTKYSVAGLKNQAAVRYRGIDIGKVQGIAIDPDNPLEIQIRISVDRTVPITRGTYGTMGYQGVTGLAYVLIEDRGNNLERLERKDGKLPRIMVKPSLLDTLSESGIAMLERASDLLERVNGVLSDKNRESLSRSLNNVETASTRLYPAIDAVDGAFTRMRKVLSDENQLKISRVLANVDEMSGEAKPLAVEVRKLVGTLQGLSERIDLITAATGDEVNGVTLPRMHELMGELVRNSRNLNTLLDEFERNPNAIIFGKPQPRAGPGEPGFSQ